MDEPTRSTSPAPGRQARLEARTRAHPHPSLTLLRHAEPDWNPRGGPVVDDPGLTAFGVEQAQAAAAALAPEGFDAIYVSPCRRAQETAAPLARAARVEPVTIDGLAEIVVPFAGRSAEEVDRAFVESARRPLSELWEGWPGGEPFRDFHARVTAAIADVLARHGLRPELRHDFTVWHGPDDPDRPLSIAVVGHGGTNAVLLTHLLDIRPVPWEWLRLESALAAYSVVQARPLGEEGRVWSLQNFNELDHLRAAKLL